jgi:putative flippase GtrA
MVRTLLDNRTVRFLLVGILNSAFGFLVFSAVVWAEQGTIVALLAGNVAGLVFNFFSTGGLVFRTLALHRLPKFVTCYVSMLIVNYALLEISANLLDSQIIAQAILTLPMAGLSYAVMTLWVYRTATDKD